MKRWIGWAARLYPASWRRRYAEEFEALLEDAKLAPADFWDVLRGGIGMQMKICVSAGLKEPRFRRF